MSDTRQKTRNSIEAELKNYPIVQRKLALLRYEYSHPPQETIQGAISGMTFQHSSDNLIRQAGYISDKTMQIAMRYQSEMDRVSSESLADISREIWELSERLDRMEFYVSQLEEKQAAIIRKYYFEGKTWRQMQSELHMSTRTLTSYRDKGLDKLAEMWQYLQQVTMDRKPQ